MKYSRAFTLLEMIVAIGIFAVIAIVSYGSLNRFLDNRDVLQAEIEMMKDLQLAFSLLEQDMHFMSERIVRDEYGDPEPLLIVNSIDIAGELLRFTTARRSVSLPGVSTLQRTSYRWENGDFIRVNWQVLDRDQDAIESEFGDVLFSMINYARFLKVNPENALERTNKKFIKRFQYLEGKAKGLNKSLKDMTLSEMDVFWEEAKSL